MRFKGADFPLDHSVVYLDIEELAENIVTL